MIDILIYAGIVLLSVLGLLGLRSVFRSMSGNHPYYLDDMPRTQRIVDLLTGTVATAISVWLIAILWELL